MLFRTLLTLLLLLNFASPPAVQAKAASNAALLKQGRKLVNEKKHKEAQTVFEKILLTEPRNAEACAGLAWSLFSQGQRDKAETYAKKSIEIDDKFPMAHNVMGAIYFAQGKVEEAKNEFRTVLRIDPKRRCGGCADLRGLLGNDIPQVQNTKGIKYKD